VPYSAVYHVQRFSVGAPPEEAGRRLAEYMARAGFSMEGNGCLPCARFVRGNLANNFFVISPKLWRVTVDTRIEPNPDGGSSVDACWTIQTVSQIVVYTETRYWRTAISELREAVGLGEVSSDRSEGAARFSALCLLLLVIVALSASGAAALYLKRHGYGFVPLTAIGIAVLTTVLFAFRDWRGLRR